ncbi:MAG: hypothetical protein ACRDFS_09170 [Chloroflexota bacterium]
MRSQLFRRETARRLRAVVEDVCLRYRGHRYPWLSAYQEVDEIALRRAVLALAEALEFGDPAPYEAVVQAMVTRMLEEGVPPIAILAIADLFHGTVACELTADQRELLRPMVEAERAQRQDILYQRVFEEKKDA